MTACASLAEVPERFGFGREALRLVEHVKISLPDDAMAADDIRVQVTFPRAPEVSAGALGVCAGTSRRAAAEPL